MMDLAAPEVSVLEQENPAGDGEKKALESAGSDPGAQSRKKVRVDCGGGGGGGGEDMRRVAEIVMVLSALGKMRAGRSPSIVERGMMAEAREKLVRMCESVAPKDLVPSDAVRSVVEDLDFNKTRDVRLGFRPPKMSIAEKVSLTKRKMEESKEFIAQSAVHSSQQLQGDTSSNSKSHGTLCHEVAAHGYPSDKSSPVSLSSGGFQPASPVVYVSALPSSTSLNQSQVAVMQPAFVLMPSFSSPLDNVSSSLPLSQVDAAHFRLDAQPAYFFQVQASSSGNYLTEASTTSSSQPPSVTVAKVGEAIKPTDHTPAMTEGAHEVNAFQLTSQAIRDHNGKTSAVQTISGNIHTVHQPFQAMNFVQAPSLYGNKNDIARNVQKILQQRLPDHPKSTPPSTNYMTEPLTCQMCKILITDVESLLVCDACEKGVHLKCLQSFHVKGIPKGDWHCPKCLITSNGKPLPPKYGLVTRNVHASKITSNSGVQASTENKMEIPVQKANHLKTIANGKPDSLKLAHMVSTVSMSNNHIEPAPDQKMHNARCVDSSVSGMKMEDGPFRNTFSDHPDEKAGETCVPDTFSERATHHIQNSESSPCQIERLPSAPNPQLEVESKHSFPDQPTDTDISTCYQSQALCNSQESGKTQAQTCVEVSANQLHDIGQSAFEELKRPSDLREPSECKPDCHVKREDQVVTQLISNESLDKGNGARCGSMSSLDGLHCVDWVGDVLKVVEDKAYYASCCINGVVYRLQDHALCSNNQNLSPVKLEVLWEDNKTKSKWAIVNQCYFPSDLPEVVGRPCTPENNEVYESNHQNTIMVGLIHSPCEVLPPDKFREENERRTHTGHGANYGFHPIFLCRWFYDESKGLFQPITD